MSVFELPTDLIQITHFAIPEVRTWGGSRDAARCDCRWWKHEWPKNTREATRMGEKHTKSTNKRNGNEC